MNHMMIHRATTGRIQSKLIAILVIGVSVMASGCTGLSGYDAGTNFSCKAPDGVTCQSMSGVYANNKPGSQPASARPRQAAQQPAGGEQKAVVIPNYQALQPGAPALATPAARNMGPNGQPPYYSGAIRTEPTTLRIWTMAFRDQDGDVVDQTYLFVTMDSGQWLIDHEESTIRDNFEPARPTAVKSRKAGAAQRSAPSEVNQAGADATGEARNGGFFGMGGSKDSAQGEGTDSSSVLKAIQDAVKGGAQAGQGNGLPRLDPVVPANQR